MLFLKSLTRVGWTPWTGGIQRTISIRIHGITLRVSSSVIRQPAEAACCQARRRRHAARRPAARSSSPRGGAHDHQARTITARNSCPINQATARPPHPRPCHGRSCFFLSPLPAESSHSFLMVVFLNGVGHDCIRPKGCYPSKTKSR